VRRFRSSRLAIAAGAASAVLALAVLATAIGTFAAQSPAAARWNHNGTTRVVPGAVAQAQAESKVPPNLVWKTIRLIEPYGDKIAFIDVGASGDSKGDYNVFRDKLQDPDSDEVVGFIDVTCMNGWADMCRGTIRLTGQGQIVFDGATPVDFDPDRYAIVGGGGPFADVGGVMQIDFPALDHAEITLTLTH
jgi:hypothetical protein